MASTDMHVLKHKKCWLKECTKDAIDAIDAIKH